ncbi:expressed unknown protein [Seminavis robusta]|uniref:Non-structural maintenance of chromosomes element 1 homolog n=1 Tax=Seminavis robusta TaxID=568900 RepID=A0A9N8HET1_9STRA|nr:expressed unknown protein [Seminavis robusta]|eukprot:Sro399_g134950.1 n/a (200) ;mRNA; f:57559-58158
MTDPLPLGQKLFLQKLAAVHTMTDETAQEFLDQFDPDDMQCDCVDDCLTSINKQLTVGFGMEIVTMVDKDGNKFHALINQHADQVAKESFGSTYDADTRYFVRQVLESLVEGPSVRSTLINLRTKLQPPLKLDIDKADQCIENLLDEHWLQRDDGDNKRRRDSMNAKIELGPRAFLELSVLLMDMGFPQDDLPQFLFHR